MNQLEIFANNLNYYMSLNNKRQIDLCRYLNVSSATVSDWCNGKKMPKTERIGDIATWLNIRVTDLFELRNPNESKLTINADSELVVFIDYYKNASPEMRKAALAVLKSSKPDSSDSQKPE